MNHLENLKLAKRKWQEVLPKHVTPGLVFWRWEVGGSCGTLACFGGHLTTWPEFQAMGVKVADSEGRPAYDSPTEDLHLVGSRVARHLFGVGGLFLAASTVEKNRAATALLDSGKNPDAHDLAWKVVDMRLDAAIAELEAA